MKYILRQFIHTSKYSWADYGLSCTDYVYLGMSLIIKVQNYLSYNMSDMNVVCYKYWCVAYTIYISGMSMYFEMLIMHVC